MKQPFWIICRSDSIPFGISRTCRPPMLFLPNLINILCADCLCIDDIGQNVWSFCRISSIHRQCIDDIEHRYCDLSILWFFLYEPGFISSNSVPSGTRRVSHARLNLDSIVNSTWTQSCYVQNLLLSSPTSSQCVILWHQHAVLMSKEHRR